MRKLHRAIAHRRMEEAGIKHINREVHRMTNQGPVNIGSYFSRHWREYCFAPKKED